MALPKRLRMDRAAYITISAQPLPEDCKGTVVGWDMADVVLSSKLSETGQHHTLFAELMMIVFERLRMAGSVKRSIPSKDLDAMAADLFAILAVNGLYRPVKRAEAVRFCRLGPEPPPHLRWSSIEEYDEVARRRKRGKRAEGRSAVRRPPRPAAGRGAPR